MPHPRHFVAAGVFLISPAERFLMVQTFNRRGEGLILPGGMVEENESPAAAASREVAEELGLTVATGRLLAVEHRSKTGDRPSSLQFVFAAESTVEEGHELKSCNRMRSPRPTGSPVPKLSPAMEQPGRPE